MKKQLIKIIASLILGIFAFILSLNHSSYSDICYVITYIIIGYDVIFKAIKNILKGHLFDENFLMAIATIGAFLIGEFQEAVAVMIFYQVGEFLQDYALDKSEKSIVSLMDIRPDYANLYINEEIKKVDPNEVKIGDIILIKSGEKVPLDGVIIEGNSTLNMQVLTGEVMPKRVKVKDEILSGSINNEEVLKVKVNKVFKESTANKILDLVKNANNLKTKSESFMTKFAKYYTPIVVIIAILLVVIPYCLFENSEFNKLLYRALTFLVVSCPCALVISIPLSFFSGIGAASKIGVLIKGSNYLEALANTEIIVCDKTGTLTEGVFEVCKVMPTTISEEELLKVAAYAEVNSNHPIAISLREAYSKKIDRKLISKTKEIAGKGVLAEVDGKTILVGNEKLMKEHKIKFAVNKSSLTLVLVAIDGKYVGCIEIADKIKKDVYQAIKAFRKNNINKIIMLTGDKQSSSEYVFKQLALDEYKAELLPHEKVAILKKILKTKKETGNVIFIGDGINDAPSLALADVGVAMGGVGVDAAIEQADIVIMTDELSKLASAIKLAKKTMKIVKQNIILAISIKVVVLILSAFSLATMWVAVFADVGVCLMAILNALRILKIKKEEN